MTDILRAYELTKNRQLTREQQWELFRKEDARFLTQSQQSAVGKIKEYFYGKLTEQKGVIAGRFQPLVVGPSGGGKSHCVRAAAEELGISFHHINLSDWIPRGASATPYSITAIQNFVRQNPHGIILLDEVDKLRSSSVSAQGWWQSIATEAFAFLDASTALESLGWEKNNVDSLKKHLVVGAGAWHEALAEGGKSMGFGEQKAPSMRDQIEQAKQIPFEVLARFSVEPVEICYPTHEDFVRGFRMILVNYGIKNCPPDKLDELAKKAVDQGRGARSLEHFATKLAIQRAQRLEKSGTLPRLSEEGKAGEIVSGEKIPLQKYYDWKEVQKKLVEESDQLASSAVVFASEICKYPALNASNPVVSSQSFSKSLDILAGNLLRFARVFGCEEQGDLEESITKSVLLSIAQIEEDRSQYPCELLSIKAADFAFHGRLWHEEYKLLHRLLS